MSRYDLTYSEVDMLDAFYAGRQNLIDQLNLNRSNSSETPFSDFIDKFNANKKEGKEFQDADMKELKDDEMRAEAQADGEQYEKELEESNQI